MSKIRKMIERAKESVSGMTDDQVDLYHALLDAEETELERISEMTKTENIDKIATTFLPAIKKLARDSVIDKIVGVQPVKSRIAGVKYTDYVYTHDDATSGAQKGKSIIDSPPTTEYSRDPGEGQVIQRGVEFVYREKEVTCKSRKLLAKWTFEAQESLKEDNFNIENELSKAMANKITEEINYEIIADLYNMATGPTTNWAAPAPADAPTVKDRKEKEIYYAIIDVSEELADNTQRVPNYIICSRKVRAILRRSGQYETITPDKNTTNIKRFYSVGVFNDEFEVYTISALATNDILVGFKGMSELEAGYIYAPRFPLIMMDAFFNVNDWTWVKSIGTNYGKAPVMMGLYGKVQVTGL